MSDVSQASSLLVCVDGKGRERGVRKTKPRAVGSGQNLSFQSESDGEPWRVPNRKEDDPFL